MFYNRKHVNTCALDTWTVCCLVIVKVQYILWLLSETEQMPSVFLQSVKLRWSVWSESLIFSWVNLWAPGEQSQAWTKNASGASSTITLGLQMTWSWTWVSADFFFDIWLLNLILTMSTRKSNSTKKLFKNLNYFCCSKEFKFVSQPCAMKLKADIQKAMMEYLTVKCIILYKCIKHFPVAKFKVYFHFIFP